MGQDSGAATRKLQALSVQTEPFTFLTGSTLERSDLEQTPTFSQHRSVLTSCHECHSLYR